MEAALRASGTEIVTVALRRVDPTAEGSVLDLIARLGLFALPNTAGCYTARDAVRTARLGARGAGDRLGQARGDRRRPDADARCRRARRRGRDPGRRGLHRAPVRERRSGARPTTRGRRLRRGDAAGLADRVRRRDPQPLQPADHRRVRRRAGGLRRRDRDRVRRGPGDGARLRRRACSRAPSPAPPIPSGWRSRCATRSRPATRRVARAGSRGCCTPRPRRPARASRT